jgi:hypothetical protein
LDEIVASFGKKFSYDEKIVKITAGMTLHELESVALGPYTATEKSTRGL